jgi:glycosyltransferase involved in cell wall biosynthesis
MSKNYIRGLVARLMEHGRNGAAVAARPEEAAPAVTNKKLDDLVLHIRSLTAGEKSALIFGDTRVLAPPVLDDVIALFERVFLIERNAHERLLAEQHGPKIQLLKSLASAVPQSVDIAFGCPVLAQIVPTFTRVTPRQLARILRTGGHLISFGIAPARAPDDVEARDYFTRYLSEEAPEVPPELAGKFIFSRAQPRHRIGRGYLTWVTLQKVELDKEIDKVKPQEQPKILDVANLVTPSVKSQITVPSIAEVARPASPTPPPATPPTPATPLTPAIAPVPIAPAPPAIPVERHNGIAFLPGALRDEKLVFSIVPNSCVHDARVMRHARALTNDGWRVRIYATAEDGLPMEEVRDSAEMRRFPGFQTDTSLAPEVAEVAMEAMGPYRPYLEERLEQFRIATALNDQLSAENQRYRGLLPTITEMNEKKVLQKDLAQFASIYRQAIPYLRKQGRYDRLKLRYFFLTANFLNQVFDVKPAIIHAHDLPSLPGAIQLAAATNAQLIFDAHELETERAPPLPIDQKRFIDFLESWWLNHVNRMVTVCDSIADFYQTRFKGARATVFMNVPELNDTGNADYDLRGAAGLSADAKTVIYTGAVGREARGLHKVVEALRLLDGVNLIILGPRAEGNDDWLLDIAESMGVRERLRLLPPVPTDQVVSAIRTADAGVCPIQDVALSYRVSMPNKLFECAFAEVPICVSDLPEMARFVTDLGIGVVMDQTDPQSIAAALREVLDNRARYALTSESRARLKDEYSWPAQSRRLQQLYREIEGTLA